MMAYVEPDAEVRLLQGVPLDIGYIHTIYWDEDDIADQTQYFLSKTAYTFSYQTYQRTDVGVIRVKEKYQNLIYCNYLMFRNTRHGNKWFYAFIKNVEYVNENTTAVYYDVDVIQSWHFDYQLQPCFIEREHASTDVAGDNLIEEDIKAGEYICVSSIKYHLPDPNSEYENKMCLICAYTSANQGSNNGKILVWDDVNQVYNADPNVVDVHGQIHSNIVNGFVLEVMPFTRDDQTSFTSLMKRFGEFIKAITSSPSGLSVVAIWEAPLAVYEYARTTTSPEEFTWLLTRPAYFKSPVYQGTSYTDVKNNKLFTYPYQVLTISNNDGKAQEYHWEYFANPSHTNVASFKVSATLQPQPSLAMYPTYYKGLTNFYEEGMEYQNFLPISWSEDTFSRWWAQNKAGYYNSIISGTIASLVGFGMTIMTGGVGGAVAGTALTASQFAMASGALNPNSLGGQAGASAIANSAPALRSITGAISSAIGAEAMPDAIRGNATADGTRVVQDRQTFTAYLYTITAERAKVIDRYFSTYGYACHDVKVPNRKVREHWTYTKTVGCKIIGNLPAGVEEQIQNVYDNGITFWVDPDEVGNYDVDHWDNEVI